ncbi:hypothetical protein N7G274_003574 [Stereocaulon virgatum]|uniref:Uncharacterized protein n=1 Tax=Stereocaulon virgatum TaxID=373712 RepID=A0ABR4AEX7_9LECA
MPGFDSRTVKCPSIILEGFAFGVIYPAHLFCSGAFRILTITAMLIMMTDLSVFADTIILVDRSFFSSVLLLIFMGMMQDCVIHIDIKDMKSAIQVYNNSELTKFVCLRRYHYALRADYSSRSLATLNGQ